MSTRSMIAATLPDGSIRAVYCHSDGYPSYNGSRLMNYWHSTGRAARVTSMGDMSTLGEIIGKQRKFEYRDILRKRLRKENDGVLDHELYARELAALPEVQEDWCLFYGRDRGDTSVQFGGVVHTIEELPQYFQAYQYLWRHETWWMHVGPPSNEDEEVDCEIDWERDPEDPTAEWVTLYGVLQRDPSYTDKIAPSPSPILRKRSIRLWKEDTVPSTPTSPVCITGRRAVII